MCYIMLVKQLKQPNNECEQAIKKILKDKMNSNRDGFYLANPDLGLRTMDKEEAVTTLETMRLKNFCCHFRIATEGKKTVHNVQGWTKDGYTFTHNGSFSGYWEKGKSALEYENSDSQRFFIELLQNLKRIPNQKDSSIKEAIQTTLDQVSNFWGRCALYSTKTDRMFLFGNWWLYKIGNSHLIISSANLYFNHAIEETKQLKGFKFKYKSSMASNIGECEIEGIGVIKSFSRDNWVYKYLGEIKKEYGFKTAGKDYKPVVYNHDDRFSWEKSKKPDTEVKVYANNEINEPNEYSIKRLLKLPVPKKLTEEEKSLSADYDEILIQRLENSIGYDENGFELYVDEGGIHDIYNYCCQYSPKKCRALSQLEDIVTQERIKTKKIEKVFGDGTEFKLNRV